MHRRDFAIHHKIFALPPLQGLPKLLQQAAAVILLKNINLSIKSSANFLKMNTIQTDENSFLNFPTVFEKVGVTI